jgi:hypothetical protein
MQGPLDSLDDFGEGMSRAFDLDGDGMLELVVGAPGDGDGSAGLGALWILNLADGSGTNPVALASAAGPLLGESFVVDVDASAQTSGGMSLVVGFAGALSQGVQLGVGELLVDPAAALVFSDLQALAAGAASHAVLVPKQCDLAGLSASLQALLFLDGGGTQLTNRLDVFVGAY